MKRRRWRAVPVVVGLAAVVSVAGVAAVGRVGLRAEPTATPEPKPAATAKISRQTLTETKTLIGQVTYGQLRPLDSKASGTTTWLPKVGATVRRGDALLRADDRPVVLLYGPIPAYRELKPDLEGNDVLQFERNLRALGYAGFTVDEEYTDYTQAAVKRWQQDLGLPETGNVEVGRIIYASGPLRIAEHKVRLGAPATGEVLSSTSNAKLVSADAETADLGWAVKGANVTVALPDGKEVDGTVSDVGAQPAASGEGEQVSPEGAQTVPVMIAVKDQRALGTVGEGQVDISYVAQERKDVLTVPVEALLALSEGGYGVELVEGGTTRLVAVQTGMFADGRVEVSGPDIEAGRTVGMPE